MKAIPEDIMVTLRVMLETMENFGVTLDEYYRECMKYIFEDDYDFEDTEEYAWLCPVHNAEERMALLEEYDRRNGYN